MVESLTCMVTWRLLCSVLSENYWESTQVLYRYNSSTVHKTVWVELWWYSMKVFFYWISFCRCKSRSSSSPACQGLDCLDGKFILKWFDKFQRCRNKEFSWSSLVTLLSLVCFFPDVNKWILIPQLCELLIIFTLLLPLST